MHKTIDKAAELETLRTAFEPLLGSAQAAQDRIAELAKFAVDTPFELPEIAKASRTLETLTRGALSTGNGQKASPSWGQITTRKTAKLIPKCQNKLSSGNKNGSPTCRTEPAVVGELVNQLRLLPLSKSCKNQLQEPHFQSHLTDLF